MWQLDHKEGWAPKNWCYRVMVLEDSWESPGQQGDQTVHPKENQPWIFNGRTDAEDEVPILWPLDAKIPFTGKDPDDGKDWGQEEKLVTEDEMAQQHHLTWWTWVWTNSGRWWRTGKSDVLQSMGLQREGHDLSTEQQQFSKYLINIMNYWMHVLWLHQILNLKVRDSRFLSAVQ